MLEQIGYVSYGNNTVKRLTLLQPDATAAAAAVAAAQCSGTADCCRQC
jgi:hypothetical protein